jgi:hypothetical protein
MNLGFKAARVRQVFGNGKEYYVFCLTPESELVAEISALNGKLSITDVYEHLT